MHDKIPTILGGATDHGSDGLGDVLPILGKGSGSGSKSSGLSLTPPKSSSLSLSPDSLLGGSGGKSGGGGNGGLDITPNRTDHFSKRTGRFHSPESGSFEKGSSPPDLDSRATRYRAKNGQFKTSPADLYDEPAEVRQNSLKPKG